MSDGSPLNRISLRDEAFASLNEASAIGHGSVKEFPAPVNIVSCQVSWTGAPSAVKVTLRGSIDGVNFPVIATFDTGASGNNGDIISSNGLTAIVEARADLETLTGGGTVTAVILSNRGG